jgi:hypothetical protein
MIGGGGGWTRSWGAFGLAENLHLCPIWREAALDGQSSRDQGCPRERVLDRVHAPAKEAGMLVPAGLRG